VQAAPAPLAAALSGLAGAVDAVGPTTAAKAVSSLPAPQRETPPKRPRITLDRRSAGRAPSDHQAPSQHERRPHDGRATSLEVFSAAVRAHAESAGVVHLALESRSNALVTSWHQQLLAIAEPSEAANALLQEAAHDSGADGEMPPPGSLEELFRGGTTAALRCGDLVTLLGHQQQPLGGGRAACYMLLRCQPATMVAPDQVTGMAGAWRGQVVVTTAGLHPSLVAALLGEGARAVVARGGDTAAPPPPVTQAFFAAFYDALLAGRTVVQAVGAGETAVPEAAGVYIPSFAKSAGTQAR